MARDVPRHTGPATDEESGLLHDKDGTSSVRSGRAVEEARNLDDQTKVECGRRVLPGR